MANQAQIDALENLLIAVLKNSKATLVANKVFDDAQALIMDSGGPGGPTEKTNAVNYLAHLKLQLK